MVFAPLIYLAHAGYLARPDCVDGDTSILSSGGGWGPNSSPDIMKRDVIKRCHTPRQKKERKKKSSVEREAVSVVSADGNHTVGVFFFVGAAGDTEICIFSALPFMRAGNLGIKGFTLT